MKERTDYISHDLIAHPNLRGLFVPIIIGKKPLTTPEKQSNDGKRSHKKKQLHKKKKKYARFFRAVWKKEKWGKRTFFLGGGRNLDAKKKGVIAENGKNRPNKASLKTPGFSNKIRGRRGRNPQRSAKKHVKSRKACGKVPERPFAETAAGGASGTTSFKKGSAGQACGPSGDILRRGVTPLGERDCTQYAETGRITLKQAF